ncbi:MAG TPA: rhamnulokinase [Clostridiaceae bacterium]|nr:rhamnulokinase [Clostridiaceae bacterium]
MMKVLAFDFGASSGRGILGTYDGKKLQLDEIHRFSNDPVMLNGTIYWDVLRLFHEMKTGILKCIQEGHQDISGIGVDTWGVDFGLIGASGELLGNPVHYRDARTEGMMEEAYKMVPKREIYEETGIQFMVFNTLYQLLYLKLKNPTLLENADKMLLMPDLFNYFLSGEKYSEYSIASTTQLLNPRTGDWSSRLIEALGLPKKIFADIINPGTVIGKVNKEIKEELLLKNDIPVIAVAGHDTGSAVVSVPATDEKFAYLSSGTWSLLGAELPEPIINETTFNLDYTNEGGYNRTTRLLKNIMGLWIYQECKRTWDKIGESHSYDELEEMAEKEEAFVCFIDPDDDLFYRPGNMPQNIIDFCKDTGQKVPESKGAIVRCIMESLALKYNMIIKGLEKILGYEIPVLHIVGGGSRNTLLSRFTANATKKTVVTGPVEATATGNLLCQLMALGEVSGLSQARQLVIESFPTTVYEPEDTAKWEEAYEKFKKIIVIRKNRLNSVK